jgi:hypothetical protein
MFKSFLRDDRGGAVTIDWLVILGGLTAAGALMVEVSTDALSEHSSNVRGELQDPYFETSWFDSLPAGRGGGAGVAGVTPVSGTPARGNNGHGNDADGCDSSNPGNSPNCRDDTTDDDGVPGGSGGAQAHETHDTAPEDEADPAQEEVAEETPAEEPPRGGGGAGTPPTSVVQAARAPHEEGCPSTAFVSNLHARTGGDLSRNGLRVEGITVERPQAKLQDCDGLPNWGRFHADATITLDLTGMERLEGFRLEVTASCSRNLLLLVRDGQGNHHWTDKGGDQSNMPAITFEAGQMGNLNGRVHVWVGVSGRNTCDDATLTMTETG